LVPDTPLPAVVIPYDALLEHWRGHRRVTRRMIQAFPDDALFGFSIGGMRPFSAMALEMIRMASAGVRGLATREWPIVYPKDAPTPSTKAELLRLWDETTDEIEALWPRIPPQRFQEVDKAFGQWEGVVYGCSSTGSTTRSIIAGRHTCTCARLASSRRPSTTGADSRHRSGQSRSESIGLKRVPRPARR